MGTACLTGKFEDMQQLADGEKQQQQQQEHRWSRLASNELRSCASVVHGGMLAQANLCMWSHDKALVQQHVVCTVTAFIITAAVATAAAAAAARLAYSRWLTDWVKRLDPKASDELLILARGK
jgi:hypothetical protein